MCLSTAPLIPQAPVSYAADSSGLAGSFFGGVVSTLACAGVAWFFSCGGRARFDRWRMGAAWVGGAEATSSLVAAGRTGGAAASSSSSSAGGAPFAGSSGGSSKFTSYGGV